MIGARRRVVEMADVTPERFEAEIAPVDEPVVMRGIAAHWPAVAAGRQSARAMADYILGYNRDSVAEVMIGAPAIEGRFFYRDDMAGFNFERAKVALDVLLEQLVAQQHDALVPSMYAGAAPVDVNLPGWTGANALSLATPESVPRIWIGNASRVSTHYDISSNIAVVVAGTRRFMLFPPDQSRNLYVGPLDLTIAGQPTSMVDIENPDLDRYPRFAAALETMMIADLAPGDAIFLPSLWWHEVTAKGPLNVLVNYWWGQRPSVSPFPALIHAILAVRDLPPAQRSAVRAWFDEYVFGADAAQAADHLPAAARGILGEASIERDQAIRDYLCRALNRE